MGAWQSWKEFLEKTVTKLNFSSCLIVKFRTATSFFAEVHPKHREKLFPSFTLCVQLKFKAFGSQGNITLLVLRMGHLITVFLSDQVFVKVSSPRRGLFALSQRTHDKCPKNGGEGGFARLELTE